MLEDLDHLLTDNVRLRLLQWWIGSSSCPWCWQKSHDPQAPDISLHLPVLFVHADQYKQACEGFVFEVMEVSLQIILSKDPFHASKFVSLRSKITWVTIQKLYLTSLRRSGIWCQTTRTALFYGRKFNSQQRSSEPTFQRKVQYLIQYTHLLYSIYNPVHPSWFSFQHHLKPSFKK